RAVQGANGAVERNGLLVQPNLETVRPLSRVLRPELVDQTSSSVLMPVVVVTGRNKAKLGGIARRAVYACFVQVRPVIALKHLAYIVALSCLLVHDACVVFGSKVITQPGQPGVAVVLHWVGRLAVRTGNIVCRKGFRLNTGAV